MDHEKGINQLELIIIIHEPEILWFWKVVGEVFSVHGFVSFLRIDFVRDTILIGNENQIYCFV